MSSLIILAIWASILLCLSGSVDPRTGIITPMGFWIMMTYIPLLIGASIFFIFSLVRVINPESNFLYMLIATANFTLGLGGIYLYVFHRINMIGLHSLLLNLLMGVIMFADILFFKSFFRRPRTTPR